ncbi:MULTISPECIES: gluconate:H+ symporter [Sphingomonas]|uniref:gluconate:H+ symporter n=1 Tax=Sphingomonas TaxID=13687 RepID=UPI0007014C7E|nr:MULTISPECIES: gluconate:H+ symporter [Sphingomonas]KQM90074.1 gluconate transporter [Sphingomonas sp. Leaf226]MDY0969406.1 gluconate:H+ symporter [Sphingomonas sp. CFBP9021]USR01794.1 gluconate:H+ symporter [Sphingomonas aerolata]
MTILAVALVVGLLVLLISVVKLHPFVAFLIAALAAAMLLGLPLDHVAGSLTRGVADMLGPLTAILCLGAMFGRIVADSGAAQRIADTLIHAVGRGPITLALALAGFIVGIPLFYNVGFVLMVPLILSVARRSGMPTVYLAVPMLSGLSIAHGFLPPHPSPTALVGMFGADIGLTLIYGLAVGIPTLLIAGPLFARSLRGMTAHPRPAADTPEAVVELPSASASFAIALLPVMLLAVATVLMTLPALPPVTKGWVAFGGNPVVTMLISVLAAMLILGVVRGTSLARLSTGSGEAVKDIAGILLIVAGAGALKQVFVDAGADVALAAWLSGLSLAPLVLGWGLAMVIRVALGSATVAGLTAAGIVQPLIAAHGVDPNLMVLAIGAGSLMFSHVNDSGFWMFKEYFGLSLAETFRSWSAMETLVGVFGLLFTLLLSLVV